MLCAMNTNVFNNRFIELRTINACLLIIRKECCNYRFKIKYAVVILILVWLFLWQLSRLCLLLYLLPKQLLENKNSCVVCNKAVNILNFFYVNRITWAFLYLPRRVKWPIRIQTNSVNLLYNNMSIYFKLVWHSLK